MKNCTRRRIARVSDRARERAIRGWARRHAEMERRGKATAEQFPNKLQGRLVAVNELTGKAVEFSFFAWDNATDIRRKHRHALREVFAS